MKKFRVKVFLFVEAESPKDAEERATVAMTNVVDVVNIVRTGSAKLIEEAQDERKSNAR